MGHSILQPKPQFSQEYKDQIRATWFRTGKKSPHRLHGIINPDENGDKPQVSTLDRWIREDFRPFADELDQKVNDEMNARLVREKVEMLGRHAETGKEVQNIALNWLRNNKENLNAIAAARLLFAGADLERLSLGIPKALEKMMQMKDEDILKRIQDIISRSPTSIEPNIEPELIDEIIDEE